jgi:hypothetical protein
LIYAIGTPINARCRPWTYEWALKPDALMFSAIDFFSSPKTYQKVKKLGIHKVLDWEGKLICDSGAFSALNRRKKVVLDIEQLKDIYKEIADQDPDITKITLDFPDDKIIENYNRLSSLEVQPVVPHNRLELLNDILMNENTPEWLFIGRLVPLMRKGGNHAKRLFPVIDNVKKLLDGIGSQRIKLWTLEIK